MAASKGPRGRQPEPTTEGRWWDDLNIFEGITIPSIDNRVTGLFDDGATQKARLDRENEEPFRTLRAFFADTQSLDAWHLHTAHAHGAFCFLTMDFKFRTQFEDAQKRRGFPELRSGPMLPSEFAAHVGLRPNR